MRQSWNNLRSSDRVGLKGAILAVGASAAAGTTNGAFGLGADMRHGPSKLFNYPQHASSVTVGTLIGASTGIAVAKLTDAFGLQEKYSQRRIRTVASGVATMLAVMTNAAIETRTGIRLLHAETFAGTPDAYDFVYGVASGAFSGAVTPSFSDEQVSPPIPDPDHETTKHL